MEVLLEAAATLSTSLVLFGAPEVMPVRLTERDEHYASEVKGKELEVNKLQIEVDDGAVKLTALQQPVASDVRFLFMASRIGTGAPRTPCMRVRPACWSIMSRPRVSAA